MTLAELSQKQEFKTALQRGLGMVVLSNKRTYELLNDPRYDNCLWTLSISANFPYPCPSRFVFHNLKQIILDVAEKIKEKYSLDQLVEAERNVLYISLYTQYELANVDKLCFKDLKIKTVIEQIIPQKIGKIKFNKFIGVPLFVEAQCIWRNEELLAIIPIIPQLYVQHSDGTTTNLNLMLEYDGVTFNFNSKHQIRTPISYLLLSDPELMKEYEKDIKYIMRHEVTSYHNILKTLRSCHII